MIAGLLVRHYKNYANLHFVPISDRASHMYSIFVGNNGVGKSAVLEAIDVVLNNRYWNVTAGMKKTEAYICPIYLIEKSKLEGDIASKVEIISNLLWSVDESVNPIFKSNEELKKWMEYKNGLKEKYETSHYFVMIGKLYDNSQAYVASLQDSVKKEIGYKLAVDEESAQKVLDEIKKEIEGLYRYIYIPVEESPNELLKLQNSAMQQLLNKNVLEEIEKLLNKKQKSTTIVNQINESLDEFIGEVNETILKIDEKYCFTNEPGSRRKLTAKDIREKILEAYFPLRTLKVQGHSVEQLSSGEQRRAIIDVIYSVLVANRDKKTERDIVIAIDEPETSMHVSNCFKQFSRLEELADIYKKQVIVTTHWYGFLPIAQSGNMQHIQNEDGNVSISTFSLSNIMESRRSFPDVIDLKSMYDLATSIIMYMRFHKDYAWIICEGSDDKKYLESVLNSDEYMILPVGGCGNVVKLYNLLYSPLTEKNEDNSGKCLFLIDTDLKMKHVTKPYEHSATKAKDIILRRLQIENGEVRLFDPTIPNTYSQTEMEDCLDKEIYFEALKACIEQSGDDDIISIIKCFHLNDEATTSVLKGDGSCIIPNSIEMLKEKSRIISFAEDSANKYAVARKYKELCQEKEEYPQHALKSVIENEWK